MLFLEREEDARARGAHIYGIVRGYGTVADAYHPSSPEPSGRWEQRAMELALEEAELGPGTIDAVVAHATGTPKGDTAEIRAINNLFGGRGLPVTSLKGTIGHTGASAGAMGLLAGITAMHEGKLAPTMSTSDPEPEIDFDGRPARGGRRARRGAPGERVRLRRSGRLARRHEELTSSAVARADGAGSSNSSWRRNQNDHGACGHPSGTSSSSPCPP